MKRRYRTFLLWPMMILFFISMLGSLNGWSSVSAVKNSDEEVIMIHDIQGEGHESPMIGATVRDVEGVVTYIYNIHGSHYFHMQSPEENYDGNVNTSEAIIVYTGTEEAIEVGDFVRVTGKVDEYHIDGYSDKTETDLSVTQINAHGDQDGNVTVVQHNVELPDSVRITSSAIPDQIAGEDTFDSFQPDDHAIDFWESIEGMRVEVAPSKAVAPQEHGNLFVVTEEYGAAEETVNGGIRLREEGWNAQIIPLKMHPNDQAGNFAVKTGDRFTDHVTGVANYGFGTYNVYVYLNEMQDAFREGGSEPQSTEIDSKEDQLTIASYNVENFSANEEAGETPPEKAARIAEALVKNLEAPDIVGLMEVQDNNGKAEGPNDADASRSYERLIGEILDQGGPKYDYANIDPEYNQDGGAPDGNIRVGFLYNPDRVILTDAEHGMATNAVTYENGKQNINPGRVSPGAFNGTRKPLAVQFEFNGESVVVVANHLNAKLGDDPVFGQSQPPEKHTGDKRAKLATVIHDFLSDIKADNPNENIVVLGDMNDVEYSAPLTILEGDYLTNLVNSVPGNDRYTHIHQGHSQVLDHMLVSNHLAGSAKIDIVHINADFTDMHERASDHDPVLAQIDLSSLNDGKGYANDDSSQTSDNGNPLSKTIFVVVIYLLIGAIFAIASVRTLIYRRKTGR